MKKAKRFLGLIIIAATVLSASGCRTINTNDIANALSEISDVMAENLTESSEHEEQTSSEAPESETSVNDVSSEAESSEASETLDEQSVVSEAESSEGPKTIYNTYQPELGDPELYIGSLATFLDEYPEAYCGNCPQEILEKLISQKGKEHTDKSVYDLQYEDSALMHSETGHFAIIYFEIFHYFPDGVPEDFKPKEWHNETDIDPYIKGFGGVDKSISLMYRNYYYDNGCLQVVWFSPLDAENHNSEEEWVRRLAWEICRYDCVTSVHLI